MNKFLALAAVIVLSLSLVIPASAQSMMGGETAVEAEHGQALPEVLNSILSKQGISQLQDIDCNKVSETELEELGDAWMETIHPGEQHEVMDRMMGGEGSESLRQAHIQMGRN